MKDESCCSRILTVLENKEEDGVKGRESGRERVMEKMRREKLEEFRLSRSKKLNSGMDDERLVRSILCMYSS